MSPPAIATTGPMAAEAIEFDVMLARDGPESAEEAVESIATERALNASDSLPAASTALAR